MEIEINKYIDSVYEYDNSTVDWTDIENIKKGTNKILDKIQEIITKLEDNSLNIDGVDETASIRDCFSIMYDDYQRQQMEFIKISNSIKTIYSKTKQR